MEAGPDGPAPAYPGWLPVLLGFLTAVGPIATDMYLPAFPALERSLGSGEGSAQITLATWFIGLSVGQLTQGALADRFGRRRPLMVATVLFTLASAGCALAPDLGTLAVMRFFAGFSGSASMVIPRAVVRDLADGHDAARLMAKLMLVMGAAPILAPTLGGAVLSFGSWRTIFWIATAYGAICAALVIAVLPETLPARHRLRVGLSGMIQRYVSVARDRVFLNYTLVAGFGMFGMFAYIGGSSPVLIERYHFSPAQYGVLFGLSAGSFIGMSQASPWLLRRYGGDALLRVATLVYLASASAMAFCAAFAIGGVYGIVPPMMVTMASMGIIMPNATVGALSRHAAQAGSASAFMGTLTFILAALSGVLVGVFADGTARPMAALLVLGAVASTLLNASRRGMSRSGRR